jgi:hypothetical protein
MLLLSLAITPSCQVVMKVQGEDHQSHEKEPAQRYLRQDTAKRSYHTEDASAPHPPRFD